MLHGDWFLVVLAAFYTMTWEASMFACGGQLTPSSSWLYGAGCREASGGMCSWHVTLFIRTSPFSDREPYYGNQVSTKLVMPTHDTLALLPLIPSCSPHLA